MPYHQLIGFLLRILKWPIALATAWWLPAALWALLRQINLSLSSMGVVMAATLAYFVVWRTYLSHQSVSAFSTLEHELNHILFALLTGNRVTGLSVTLSNGGHMRYEGTPNWLVDVAPYFFPLATLTVILVMPNVSALQGLAGQFLLGLTLGYHLTSGWTHLHPGQTDLQKAGFLFCGFFLPTANACSLGLTLAAARQQWIGMSDWVDDLANSPWQWTQLF